MIKSFKDKRAEALFRGESAIPYANIERPARARLGRLHAATRLQDLAALRGNGLHALAGDRLGQYAIKVNDQFRICFVWRDGAAYDVEIVDYH